MLRSDGVQCKCVTEAVEVWLRTGNLAQLNELTSEWLWWSVFSRGILFITSFNMLILSVPSVVSEVRYEL